MCGESTFFDTANHTVDIVFHPAKFDFLSNSIENRICRTLVTVSWLADASWINDEATVDRGFMLNMRVAEHDPCVVI